ncbi:uncharacterized protein ARMOST_07592 [Armillaria ostoyae]|uniref:Uncharacterized protein n=1 Tax=Armillaria ostoyae TaxID=47428 RepID=A0A284R692_ARMOS|nr:uncharacterized protein ARMOST_07592 [Armillaria ostoyae]
MDEYWEVGDRRQDKEIPPSANEATISSVQICGARRDDNGMWYAVILTIFLFPFYSIATPRFLSTYPLTTLRMGKPPNFPPATSMWYHYSDLVNFVRCFPERIQYVSLNENPCAQTHHRKAGSHPSRILAPNSPNHPRQPSPGSRAQSLTEPAHKVGSWEIAIIDTVPNSGRSLEEWDSLVSRWTTKLRGRFRQFSSLDVRGTYCKDPDDPVELLVP